MEDFLNNGSNVLIIIILIVLFIASIIVIRRNKGKCNGCSHYENCPFKVKK